MTTFPVIDSTLSATHLSAWIKEKYDLDDSTTCRLFRTNMNHTYFVSASDQQYVLRVYSHNRRTETEISAEIRLLHLLKANDISVSYPISDRNNNYIQKINAPEGIRYAVLFSFGEGRKIRFLTEELSYAIGNVMARMHQTTLHQSINRIHYDIYVLAEWAYQQASAYFAEDLEAMLFVKASGAMLKSQFHEDTLQRIRSGIVHLDIWYDNMSINDEGQITLFDFDNCGNGWLVLDIGYFCMQLFYIEQDKSVYEKKLAKFLEGYRAIIPVPDEEIKLIPYAGLAIWIYYLGIQAERFDNFSNIFFTENYVKMYIGKVRDWLKYHHIETETAGPAISKHSPNNS